MAISWRHLPDATTERPTAATRFVQKIPAATIPAIGLSISTGLSVFLLASSISSWTFPTSSYRWIQDRRATIQLIIQAVSNALALIYLDVLGRLVNSGTRIHWRENVVSMQTLRFWNALCVRACTWQLPIHLMLPVLLYILATATPSAIWAAALTPVGTMVVEATATVSVPQYRNTSNLREFPSEIGHQGPILRTPKGVFAYSVGLQLLGSLLETASSATPVDGSVRVHKKLDGSGFAYVGRSYGVGAAVGLLDDRLVADDFLQGYVFEEDGYDTSVSCMYNASSRFHLVPDGNGYFEAFGRLPNSGSKGPEDSTYIGHSPDSIVAIGVGRNPDDPRRMLAITAGNSYGNLNATQCSFFFQPTRFNVSVNALGTNITVQPLARIGVSDYAVQKNLTQTLLRQFELISNAQTNLYISSVGNALNNSITDYVTANMGSSVSLGDATLRGLENSLVAMVDDMLVGYASAQLMIENDTAPVNATTVSLALRLGEDKYIYLVFGVNVAILLLVAIEGMRTRGWRGMASLDYLDPVALLLVDRSLNKDDMGNSTAELIQHGVAKEAHVVGRHALWSQYDRVADDGRLSSHPTGE